MATLKIPVRRKRRLPDLPNDLDATNQAVITVMRKGYAKDLAEVPSLDINDEAREFLALLEKDYPIALKEFVEYHIVALMADMLRQDLGAERQASRNRERIEAAREQARLRAIEQGIPFEESMVITPMFKTFGGIDNKGKFRQLAHMNRKNLQVIIGRYQRTSASSAQGMLFHEALASRLTTDDEVVADKWTEQEVENLRKQIYT